MTRTGHWSFVGGEFEAKLLLEGGEQGGAGGRVGALVFGGPGEGEVVFAGQAGAVFHGAAECLRELRDELRNVRIGSPLILPGLAYGKDRFRVVVGFGWG